jgi:hypothetical protein
MPKGKSRIKDYIRQLSDPDVEYYAVPGTVTKVSGMVCDVDPLDGSGTLFGVQLAASEASGFLIKPNVNSVVIVTMLSNSEGFLSAWSEVDSIVVLDGKNGGIPISGKVASVISELQSRVNQLEQFAATHTHVTPAGPSATATPPYVPKTITPTAQKDIENPNFKH